jgi:hypothetical protein
VNVEPENREWTQENQTMVSERNIN